MTEETASDDSRCKMLDRALIHTFSKLSKEELVNLAVLLIHENLHAAGRKRKEKSL